MSARNKISIQTNSNAGARSINSTNSGSDGGNHSLGLSTPP